MQLLRVSAKVVRDLTGFNSVREIYRQIDRVAEPATKPDFSFPNSQGFKQITTEGQRNELQKSFEIRCNRIRRLYEEMNGLIAFPDNLITELNKIAKDSARQLVNTSTIYVRGTKTKDVTHAAYGFHSDLNDRLATLEKEVSQLLKEKFVIEPEDYELLQNSTNDQITNAINLLEDAFLSLDLREIERLHPFLRQQVVALGGSKGAEASANLTDAFHDRSKSRIRDSIPGSGLFRAYLLDEYRPNFRNVDFVKNPKYLPLLRKLLLDRNIQRAIDLAGANLSGADLSGLDLSRTNLQGANLSGANLSGAKLLFFEEKDIDLHRRNSSQKDWHKNLNLENADLSGCEGDLSFLSSCNLVGTNLSRLNLENVNLKGKTLRKVNFSECDLSKLDLSASNLMGAIFSGTKIDGTNFSHAILDNVDFRSATIYEEGNSKSSFYKASLKKANLSGLRLVGIDFQKANLTEANLERAAVGGANFEFANLSKVNLSNTLLFRTNLNNVSAEEANFSKSTFANMRIMKSNFERASFEGASFDSSSDIMTFWFNWCNFTGANFTGSSFIGASTLHSTFFGANFTRAELGSAEYPFEIEHSNFDNTIFQEAKFTNSQIKRSHFLNANFEDAVLWACIFSESNLASATNLQIAPFPQSFYDRETIFPNTFSPEDSEMARINGDGSIDGINQKTGFNGIKTSNGTDLSKVDFRNLDLTYARFYDAKLPNQVEAYFDPQDTESAIKFITNVLEGERKYRQYGECFKSISAESLVGATQHLLLGGLSGDTNNKKIFDLLTKLFNKSDGLDNARAPKRVYKNFAEALSLLKAKYPMSRPLNLFINLIRSDKLTREPMIKLVEVLMNLKPQERILFIFHYLSNLNIDEKNTVIDSLLPYIPILNLGSPYLTQKYFSQNSEIVRKEVREILKLSSDVTQRIELITRNAKNLSREQLEELNTKFSLGISKGLNDKNFRQGLMNELHKKRNDSSLNVLLQDFIDDHNLTMTDTHFRLLYENNIPQILQNQSENLLRDFISELPFIDAHTREKLEATSDPDLREKKLIILGYLKTSVLRNSAVIEHIYPIIKPFLETQVPMSEIDIQRMCKDLLTDFDSRFESRYRFKWSEKMKELHPRFNSSKLRTFSFTHVNSDGTGTYEFKALNPIDQLFNWKGIKSYMCTEPTQINDHVQLGLVGTPNMVWIDCYKDGVKGTGFFIRVLMSGRILISSPYSYGSGLNNFEEDIAREFQKHIGVSVINEERLKNANVKEEDMNISSLGGVLSYMEAGTIHEGARTVDQSAGFAFLELMLGRLWNF